MKRLNLVLALCVLLSPFSLFAEDSPTPPPPPPQQTDTNNSGNNDNSYPPLPPSNGPISDEHGLWGNNHNHKP
ncbi:MAG: hypothetical protein HQM10_23095 [Candidatus Riflebacteria bacterium]|nr:hypothetical protein [Candidatus Riflebacteria bacterium]